MPVAKDDSRGVRLGAGAFWRRSPTLPAPAAATLSRASRVSFVQVINELYPAVQGRGENWVSPFYLCIKIIPLLPPRALSPKLLLSDSGPRSNLLQKHVQSGDTLRSKCAAHTDTHTLFFSFPIWRTYVWLQRPPCCTRLFACSTTNINIFQSVVFALQQMLPAQLGECQ